MLRQLRDLFEKVVRQNRTCLRANDFECLDLTYFYEKIQRTRLKISRFSVYTYDSKLKTQVISMKLYKTLLIALAIPAFAAASYAGSCCKSEGSKKTEKSPESTEVVSIDSADTNCKCQGGSKDKDESKDKA
tara:strand:- start:39130 stop:39525 length:396 start_codon:yes stop_codon:yes gene_type:complete